MWAQGAALAVEDALILSDLLASHDDWTAVGPEFDRRRSSRVSHVQTMIDRMSRAAAMPPWLRDALMPFAGPRTYRAVFGPLRTPVT